MKKKILLVAALLALFTASATAAETTVDDFEYSDLTSQWSNDGLSISECETQSNQFWNDSRAINCHPTSAGGAINNDYGISNSDQYWRWAIKLEDNRDAVQFRPQNGNGNRLAIIGTDQNGADGEIMWYNGNSWQGTGWEISNDEWVELQINMDWNNNQYDIELANGTTLKSGASFANSASSVEDLKLNFADHDGIENNQYLDLIRTATSESDFSAADSSNSPPSIDSTSLKPSDPDYKNSISYQVNATDSDGDTMTAFYDIDYWNNGSDLKEGKFSKTGTGSFEAVDAATASFKDDGLNNTIKVSDGNTNTSTSKDFYIRDNDPVFDWQRPNNKEFKFILPLRVDLKTDNDDIPNEDVDIRWNRSGKTVESRTITEQTFIDSDYTENDLVNKSWKLIAEEQDGDKTIETRQVNVKAFEYQSTSTDSQVYETDNQSFTADIKIGSMVDSYDLTLFYNGDNVKRKSYSESGISTYTKKLYHGIPLVNNNDTSRDWYFNTSVNYTDGNNNFNIVSKNTSNQSQDIWHGFYLKNQSLDKDKYVERDNAVYTSYLYNKSPYPSLNKDIKNNLSSSNEKLETGSLVANDVRKYTGKSKIPDIKQEESAFGVLSNYNLSFQDSNREITTSRLEASVHQITLQKCSQGGETALEFETLREKDLTTQAESKIDLAVQVWNPSDPDFKRTFNASSDNSKVHSFCIEPGYATYQVDNTKKLLQYEESSNNPDDYALRSYFLQNLTIDNSTTTIPLYMRLANQTSRVGFEVLDSNDNPESGLIVKNERYFPSRDSYIPVSMIRTGSQGTSETFLEVNEIYYRFKVYDGNTLLQEEPDQIIPGDLEVTITLGDETSPSYYDFEGTVSHSCVTNATHVECSYDGPESLSNVTLRVDKQEPVDFTTVCTSFSRTSSATLRCPNLNTSENRYKYFLEAEDNQGNTETVVSEWLGQLTSDFGDTGVMISLFLFITMSFAGLWRPSATIMLGTLALLVSTFTGFLAITQTALISIIALAAVLIWRMN